MLDLLYECAIRCGNAIRMEQHKTKCDTDTKNNIPHRYYTHLFWNKQ